MGKYKADIQQGYYQIPSDIYCDFMVKIAKEKMEELVREYISGGESKHSVPAPAYTHEPPKMIDMLPEPICSKIKDKAFETDCEPDELIIKYLSAYIEQEEERERIEKKARKRSKVVNLFLDDISR